MERTSYSLDLHSIQPSSSLQASASTFFSNYWNLYSLSLPINADDLTQCEVTEHLLEQYAYSLQNYTLILQQYKQTTTSLHQCLHKLELYEQWSQERDNTTLDLYNNYHNLVQNYTQLHLQYQAAQQSLFSLHSIVESYQHKDEVLEGILYHLERWEVSTDQQPFEDLSHLQTVLFTLLNTMNSTVFKLNELDQLLDSTTTSRGSPTNLTVLYDSPSSLDSYTQQLFKQLQKLNQMVRTMKEASDLPPVLLTKHDDQIHHIRVSSMSMSFCKVSLPVDATNITSFHRLSPHSFYISDQTPYQLQAPNTTVVVVPGYHSISDPQALLPPSKSHSVETSISTNRGVLSIAPKTISITIKRSPTIEHSLLLSSLVGLGYLLYKYLEI